MYLLRLLRQYLNPLNSRGYFLGPHVALAALALFTAFLLGAFTGGAAVHYGERYFQHHYQAPLAVPAKRVQLPRVGPKPSLPAVAWVNRPLMPSVTDQDGLGACESEATIYYQLSYAWRQAHPGSYLRFSSRYAYSVYSDNYSGGNDTGSDPVRLLTGVSERGVPRFKQWPYPPNQIDSPAQLADAGSAADPSDPPHPSADQLAAKYKMAVSFEYIAQNPGGGQVAVDDARAQIAAGVPVNLGIPVYPTFDAAGAYGGHVLMPDDTMQSRGGHAVTIIGYDDTHTYDGITGWFRIRNSWTKYWGDGGNAWIPYAYVANYGFLIGTLHLDGPQTIRLSSAPTTLRNPRSGGYWVHRVRTLDTGLDVTRSINHWGGVYHVWPAGLTAMLATESGIRQYAPHNWGGADVSEGIAQFTDQTAETLGVCSDHWSCTAWLNVPDHSIMLAARYLAYGRSVTGLRLPALYNGYQQGFFAPRYNLLNPPPVYPAQAARNYASNLNFVLNRYA